jgi:hypothetical protein
VLGELPTTPSERHGRAPTIASGASEEDTMLEAFRMGGWAMFPTLVFGLLTVGAAIRFAWSPERRWVPLQLSLGVLTVAAGGLGFVTGVIKSMSAMDRVQPEQRWIWMLGVGESLQGMALALLLVTLGAMAASVGAYRLSRMPSALQPG